MFNGIFGDVKDGTSRTGSRPFNFSRLITVERRAAGANTGSQIA